MRNRESAREGQAVSYCRSLNQIIDRPLADDAWLVACRHHDIRMSVILVTGSYDHEIRFWEAWSGICSRTIARSGETGVSEIPLMASRRT